MISCEIHDTADIDGFPLGGGGARFNFDRLPKLGDILWLGVNDTRNEDAYKEIVCTVVFVAHRSSNIRDSYSGYLVVQVDTEGKYGGYHVVTT